MKKTLFAKILILIMCMALLLCGCNKAGNDSADGGSGGSGKPKSPAKQTVSAFGNTMSAIFAGGASTQVLEDALKTGKITVTVGDKVENVLYINSEKMQIADELKLDIEGVEVEAEIYLNENDLVVALPEILDDAYGVDLKNLMNDLKDSALWEMMGTDYDEVIGELESSMGDVTELVDQLQPLLEDLRKTIDSMLACVDSSVSSGTVNVDGQDVKATVITYSFDNEDLNEMVDIVFDYVSELSDQLASMGGDIGEIADGIEEGREMVKSTLEQAEIDFKLVINVNASTGYVMTIDGDLKLAMDGEEGTVNFDANFGEDASKSDRYTMDLTATHEGETLELLSVVLDRDVNGSETDYDLIINADGDDVFRATLNYDNDSSAYSLSLGGYSYYYDYYDDTSRTEWDYVTIDGTYKLTDDYFEFSVASVTDDDYSQDIDVKIVIEAISAGEIPKAPSYTNILKMSEKDWMELGEELTKHFDLG